VWPWAIPAAGALVRLAWAALLASYRQLNRAKFEVLELERDLPPPPFAREQALYRAEGRRSLARVERLIPGCFVGRFAARIGRSGTRYPALQRRPALRRSLPPEPGRGGRRSGDGRAPKMRIAVPDGSLPRHGKCLVVLRVW
jgi:hypothetical protein